MMHWDVNSFMMGLMLGLFVSAMLVGTFCYGYQCAKRKYGG